MSEQSKVDKMNLQKKPNGEFRLKKNDSKDFIMTAIIIGMILVTIFFVFVVIDYKWDIFSWTFVGDLLKEMIRIDLVPNDLKLEIISRVYNTVLLGFMTTILGVVIALPFGLLAARNITNQTVSRITKGIFAVIRAIPTIVWVLMFVAGYGLTSTTAIIGMTFHTVSFFVKSFSESFEEVDPGSIEALKATGASKLQIITGAILPDSYTKLISWIATRTEISFAVAVVIGPAVGVPDTIGSVIRVFRTKGNYNAMLFAVLCVFLVALLFEILASRIKRKALL